MKGKISFYSYITASLSLIVPLPGRLAYGIVALILLNFLMLFGTFFRKLIQVLDLLDLQHVLLPVFLMFLTILFKQFLIIYSPIMALSMGFLIYMPAVSSFLIGCLYDKSTEKIKTDLYFNMKESLIFSFFALLIFLFRDIFGFGTLSFPGKFKLIEVIITNYNPEKTYIGVFWASIPGALVITALGVVFITHFLDKSEEVKNDTL